MKTPTINSRILKLEVLKGTATRTSVNAVESRTTSLESDVATAQSDISTLQGDVTTLTQGIVDAVSTHNTAPDAHADIRTLVAGKQDAGNFAGSSTPGGAATTALACTGNAATATTASSCTGNSATATTASSCSGNAATATTLATARTLTIGSKANTFDGSADKAWTIAEIGAVASEDRVSFTPTIRFETPGTGVIFDTIDATSSKVGRICVVHVGLRLTNIGSGASGALIISGFPNSPIQTGNDYSYHYATAYAGDYTPYAALFSRYAPNLYIYKPYINWGVGNYMNITFSYEC